MAEEEFIDGVPVMMTGYRPEGPDAAAVVPGGSLVVIADTECVGFAAADQEAVGRLLAFVDGANAGIEHLREVARACGDAYLESDTAARFALIDLTEPLRSGLIPPAPH
jgi:hypothetical protein